jgi:hypothetical protein
MTPSPVANCNIHEAPRNLRLPTNLKFTLALLEHHFLVEDSTNLHTNRTPWKSLRYNTGLISLSSLSL